LTVYNEYGVWHKCQFKIGYKRMGKMEDGPLGVVCFHLVCANKHVDEEKHIRQGLDLMLKD